MDPQTITSDILHGDASELQTLYSVSQLNRLSKQLLESQLSNVYVEGEISNLVQPSSGHRYFSLKDSKAQIRCAMFKGQGRRLNFKPHDGMQVIARGTISLYEPRGDYQLIVETLEKAGLGQLQKAFEQLKKQLQAAGLFDQGHKQQLPSFPRAVGVVTSATGAAIRDILQVSARRFPGIPIIVYPCSVQGQQAKFEIVQAIKQANQQGHCDILIVGRGGGSLEDLWPFNEAMVAQAIFDSSLPIVSAVGHEIDFTIADFVADVRAPTPSAAAEIVFPDQQHYHQQLQQLSQRLLRVTKRQQTDCQQQLTLLRSRLKHPQQILRERIQHLDTLELRLIASNQQALNLMKQRLQQCRNQLLKTNPRIQLKQTQANLQALYHRLLLVFTLSLNQSRNQLKQLENSLLAYSPEATLARGYSIITNAKTKQLISHRRALSTGDCINIQLQDGNQSATIT